MARRPSRLKLGQRAPRSDQYPRVGPRGGEGPKRTIAKNEPQPPTSERSNEADGHQRDESAWRDRVKAHLAAQVAEGGKLYGYRKDGAYVVRTKDRDRITTPGHANR